MAFSLNPSCQPLPNNTNAENAIRGIFIHHEEKIKEQFSATKTIEDMHKYADELIQSIDADYNRLHHRCQKQCEEHLETTRAYCDAQNVELFNELYNACQLLEFQMVQLESATGTLNGYKLITVEEQIERKRRETCMVNEREKNESQVNEAKNQDLSVKASLTDSNLNSSEVQTSIYNAQTDDTDNDQFVRCPICFMLYPTNITRDDRLQHVNEHYTDN
ncbi:hypothetical protein I4U23_009745 [Adineta vaga]|nr:hypothetical protein I4U23_009745 [Adineta vaga]